MKTPRGDRLRCFALVVAIGLGCGAPLSASRQAGQAARPSSQEFTLGDVTVSIPPPRGFEEVLSRIEDMKTRMPDSDRLENLAAHLPVDVVKTFTPGQDLKFYTKVSISKSGKTADISDATFADVAKQLAGARVYEEASFKERLAELERQRGVIVEQPSQMGIIDQTPRSATTLALSAVSMGERKVNLLMAMSILHVRHRLLFVYTYRVFETAKDPTILQDFTKEWVRSILAANP